MAKLGIDFGTSTTIAAFGHDGQARVLADGRGETVVPSIVAFTPGGRVEVGRSAQARCTIDPKNTLYSVKRVLGRTWLSQEVQDFKRQYPFDLEKGADDTVRFVTRAGKLTAPQAVAYILASISEHPGFSRQTIQEVSVSVPVMFQAAQREAMLQAVRQAGFGQVEVVDEPRAAVAPYLTSAGASERLVAVYDLGGGTFDVAVLKCAGKRSDVLAVGGDAYLGGDDIDLRLAGWVADEVLRSHRWDVRSSPQSLQTLRLACERAKIRLSQLEFTALPLGQVDSVLEGKDVRIDRTQLESLVTDLVRRTFVTCDRALSDAGVRASSIDTVIMAGGGAYIPLVRRTVAQYFGRDPRQDVTPDHLVALGAAQL